MMLLGLIGGVALLLPLSQVLRFQVEQLADLQAERSRLDPMLRAVAVQRGLIGHDEVATRVLRGRAALEGERRLRQAEVDRSLATLHGTLMAGHWQRASRESVALQADWRTLALAVAHRHIDAPTSGDRHRLLLEQAVQVMDLVEAGSASNGPPQGRTARRLGTMDLKAMQDDLEDQLAVVEARAIRTRAERDLTAVSLVMALCLSVWMTLVNRHRLPSSARLPQAANSNRRSHGRRVTDYAIPGSAAELMISELAALKAAREDELSRR